MYWVVHWVVHGVLSTSVIYFVSNKIPPILGRWWEVIHSCHTATSPEAADPRSSPLTTRETLASGNWRAEFPSQFPFVTKGTWLNLTSTRSAKNSETPARSSIKVALVYLIRSAHGERQHVRKRVNTQGSTVNKHRRAAQDGKYRLNRRT